MTTKTPQPGLLRSEFIYDEAPFPSCHASTIAETPEGLVAAWFGGSDEGFADVAIWTARREAPSRRTDAGGGSPPVPAERGWSTPTEAANGDQPDGGRYPCWNPVLFQMPGGPLLLFYKVGPDPEVWWGMVAESADGGRSWHGHRRLPDGILGPIKNKPVLAHDGALLCPSSTEHDGWRIHLERSADGGATWQIIGPLNDGKEFGVIQPSILTYPGGRMQLLCRSLQGVLVESWSEDRGASWSPLAATALPNPNSGTDAVMLADGRALLVYNHTAKGRTPLNVAVSKDGATWTSAVTLETEPGEYSYPAVIQASNGLVHITYTWHRKRIRHVVVDPAALVAGPLPEAKPEP